MPVVEYTRKRWVWPVAHLMAAIYPDWTPTQWEWAGYDEGVPEHLLTLLAVVGDIPVAQLHVFRIGKEAQLGNVGCHVHPDWQRRGIGSLLFHTAWPRMAGAFADGLIAQTRTTNVGGQALALKAGFSPMTTALIDRYRATLGCIDDASVVCLHLPCTEAEPPAALRRTADYGARQLRSAVAAS